MDRNLGAIINKFLATIALYLCTSTQSIPYLIAFVILTVFMIVSRIVQLRTIPVMMDTEKSLRIIRSVVTNLALTTLVCIAGTLILEEPALFLSLALVTAIDNATKIVVVAKRALRT